MKRLAGKVAIVTGAGRGIGAAIALAFAREGASVVLAELDVGTARETAARIADETGSQNVLAVETDVTQSVSVQRAVAQAEQAFGPVDTLVNNAGINVFRDPLTMTDDDWRRCFAVDLDGVWNGCRAVLPGMVERGDGRIVNISSRAWLGGFGQANYSAAKGGVVSLTRSLAIEFAAKGVTVNAVAPGIVDTPLFRNFAPAVQDKLKASVPVRRIGTADDIALAVEFFLDPAASYVTGQTLYVLSLAGFTAERREIQRGIDFLVATQKPDGSWPMISRSTPNGEPGSSKLLTPITCTASSWSTLGLVRLVPKKP